MKYIQLNNTDLDVSRICLGTAGFGDKLDQEKSFEVLDAFIRAGGNFIDTANVYCKWLEGHGNCSEQIIGKWLKDRGAEGKVIVATKGAHYSFEDPGRSRVNREDIRADLDESCRTLGKDEIDFYWLHRDDPEKPVEEIVDILEELKKEGRIRYYGFSNYCTERLKQIEKCLRDRNLPGITAVSNQWSLAGLNPGGNTNPDPTLVEFSGEEFKWHCETGAASIPFSSTAMGFFPKLQKMGLSCTEAETDASWMQEKEKQIANLSESMKKAYWNETNLRTYQKLLKLQKETGHSLQALSLAYFFHQPFQTVPVTGVSNLTQLKDAIDACEIDLAPERFGGWVSAGGDQ